MVVEVKMIKGPVIKSGVERTRESSRVGTTGKDRRTVRKNSVEGRSKGDWMDGE